MSVSHPNEGPSQALVAWRRFLVETLLCAELLAVIAVVGFGCGVPKLDRALERGGLPLSRGRSLPALLGTRGLHASVGFERLLAARALAARAPHRIKAPHRFYDDLLLVDSTPVECARSRETVKRSQLADAADYGYCRSHSRFFWGFRLHGIFAPDGTPRAVTVASPKRDERDVALELLARTHRDGPVTLVVDKGYAGKAFARAVSDMDATILRPVRKDESGRGPHLAPSRQQM